MQNRQNKEEPPKTKKPRVNPHLIIRTFFYSNIFFQVKKEPGATTKKETVKKETKTAKRPKPSAVNIQ
jgi:hypothetical protein